MQILGFLSLLVSEGESTRFLRSLKLLLSITPQETEAFNNNSLRTSNLAGYFIYLKYL